MVCNRKVYNLPVTAFLGNLLYNSCLHFSRISMLGDGIQFLPYYNESIGFDISTTHKLAQDKPTVVISIPCATLGIDIPDKSTENVEADFCLRAFKKYIDELNAELYNRSRPDNENGKYYLCAPGGEIIKRNTAYFALCQQKDYTNGSGSTVYLLSDGISRPPLICLCIRIQVQFPLYAQFGQSTDVKRR